MGGRDQFDRKVRTAALNRRSRVYDEASDLAHAHETVERNWRATCRHCHEELEGTAAQLKEHICGEETS